MKLDEVVNKNSQLQCSKHSPLTGFERNQPKHVCGFAPLLKSLIDGCEVLADGGDLLFKRNHSRNLTRKINYLQSASVPATLTRRSNVKREIDDETSSGRFFNCVQISVRIWRDITKLTWSLTTKMFRSLLSARQEDDELILTGFDENFKKFALIRVLRQKYLLQQSSITIGLLLVTARRSQEVC